MDEMRPLFSWRSAVMTSELPAMTKYVALALSLHMNEMGGSCYPSASRLASEASVNVSTVWAALKRLQDDSWLVVVERGGQKGERRRANVYQARVPIAQDDVSASTYRPGRARPVVQDDTSTSLRTNTSPLVLSDGSSTTIGSPLSAEEREAAKCRARKARESLTARVGDTPQDHERTK